MKQSICDACHRYSEPHGSLCEGCQKDYDQVYRIYQQLLERRPELRGKTVPQVMLQLAKSYVGA